MARRLIFVITALMLVVPASASAAKRYTGCVAESSGCHHRFFGGDLPALWFKDRQGTGTVYKVCVRDAVGKRCWHRHDTAAAGHWQRAIFLMRIRSTRNVARWYVNGKQVARWKFHIVAESESAAATKRFSGCVAESAGCTHRFTSGSSPVVRFKDRKASHTAYRVCVRDNIGRRCWHRTTGSAGRWHAAMQYYAARAYGKHVVRWYVHDKQVARWIFQLHTEGD
jgi:hypothetical protein